MSRAKNLSQFHNFLHGSNKLFIGLRFHVNTVRGCHLRLTEDRYSIESALHCSGVGACS